MISQNSRINVIDDFFSFEEFNLIKHYQENSTYVATYQPSGIYYHSRLKAYPTWECSLNKDNPIYDILSKNIKTKISKDYQISSVLLRKVYKDELLKSPFNGKNHGVIHQDDTEGVVISGLIYFNSFSINDGTSLFSYKQQLEADMIIGSKPNRCIFYDSSIYHAAGIDWEERVRNTLVFFLKKNDI
jgi:hypothetical protein